MQKRSRAAPLSVRDVAVLNDTTYDIARDAAREVLREEDGVLREIVREIVGEEIDALSLQIEVAIENGVTPRSSSNGRLDGFGRADRLLRSIVLEDIEIRIMHGHTIAQIARHYELPSKIVVRELEQHRARAKFRRDAVS